MKNYSFYFIIGILIFHVGASLFATYSLFSDFKGWTTHHFYPVMMWLFTAFWLAIFLKKRWGAFAYFMLVFYEIVMKLFFGKFIFGEVFGNVFFPIDLIFAFVILILYRQYFGDRETEI